MTAFAESSFDPFLSRLDPCVGSDAVQDGLGVGRLGGLVCHQDNGRKAGAGSLLFSSFRPINNNNLQTAGVSKFNVPLSSCQQALRSPQPVVPRPPRRTSRSAGTRAACRPPRSGAPKPRSAGRRTSG